MEDMQLNLTFYTTPLPDNSSSFNDVVDYVELDGTIDGANGNVSDLCPNLYMNYTYLNVSCDSALNFSVPLLGTYIRI